MDFKAAQWSPARQDESKAVALRREAGIKGQSESREGKGAGAR